MKEHSLNWIKRFRKNPEYANLRFKKLESGYKGYPPFDFDGSLLDIVDLETFIKVEKKRIPLFIGTQSGIYPWFYDYPDFYNADKTVAVLGKSLLSGHITGLGIYSVKANSKHDDIQKNEIIYFKNEDIVPVETQILFQEAIKFACYKHLKKKQKVTGTKLPYVVHLSNVTMEIFMAALYTENFNLDFAVQVALLHDTIEDTSTSYDEIKDNLSEEIADAVLALSKDENLPKNQQTKDSLIRIKKLPKEVWAVKLADRITNLQPPPSKWNNKKKLKYQKEAKLILGELQNGNEYLADRLRRKIEEYGRYIKT